ncbi:MAG: hypothetical protein K0Q67_2637 [Cellvibrio sp.]|nr:hypothetical protein [Cellvibrio sp.]
MAFFSAINAFSWITYLYKICDFFTHAFNKELLCDRSIDLASICAARASRDGGSSIRRRNSYFR